MKIGGQGSGHLHVSVDPEASKMLWLLLRPPWILIFGATPMLGDRGLYVCGRGMELNLKNAPRYWENGKSSNMFLLVEGSVTRAITCNFFLV